MRWSPRKWGNYSCLSSIMNACVRLFYFPVWMTERITQKPTGYIMRNGALNMCLFDCVGTEPILLLSPRTASFRAMIIKHKRQWILKIYHRLWSLIWAGGYFLLQVLLLVISIHLVHEIYRWLLFQHRITCPKFYLITSFFFDHEQEINKNKNQ